MSREANFKQLLTIARTAELLGVSRARGFELARNGTLPVVKLGRQLRVPLAALEKLIDEGGKPLGNIQDTNPLRLIDPEIEESTNDMSERLSRRKIHERT